MRLFDFVRREGRGLGVIGLFVFGLAVLLVSGSRWLNLPSLSYTAVANLIVAAVATTSLYIAWRELIRKTQPNITIDYDSQFRDDGTVELLSMDVINSGENVLTPTSAWYGMVKQVDDGLYFTNREIDFFDEGSLQTGDAVTIEIDDDVILFRLRQVNITDWRGNSDSIEDIERDRVNPILHSGIESDLHVPIQKLFDAVMNLKRGCGITISTDELHSLEVHELREKYDLNTEEIPIGRVGEESETSEAVEAEADVE